MTKSYFRIFTSRSKQLLMFLAISPVIMTSCSKEELPQVTTDLPATGNWDPKSQLNDIFKKNEYTLNMNLANSEKVKGGNGREYSISGFINDRIYLALTPEPNQTGLVADTTYLRPLQTLGLAYDVDFVKTTPGTYVFTVTEFQRENNQSHILIKMGQKK